MPVELPATLDPATLRFVAEQMDREVSFWRGKMIAHPKNPLFSERFKECNNRVALIRTWANQVESRNAKKEA